MHQRHFDSAAAAQALRELFREIDRTMLPAGTAERNHQVFEAALPIVANAGIDQRQNTGQKLMHAFLLVEIVDHGRVFPSQSFEALFASGIRQAAPVKSKSTAVASFVFRQSAMKR